MIKIEPIDNDYRNGLTMEGHADFAPHGYDIVCASASTALRMAYNALSHISVLTVRFASGDAYMQLHNVSDASDVVMRGLIETLQELQEQYPEHIKLRGDMSYVKN